MSNKMTLSWHKKSLANAKRYYQNRLEEYERLGEELILKKITGVLNTLMQIFVNLKDSPKKFGYMRVVTKEWITRLSLSK